MSKKIDLTKLPGIFFGCEDELGLLDMYYQTTNLDYKKVVILNAPGVGKTALVKKFF